MKQDFKLLLDAPPVEVKWGDIIEFNKLDERISAVGALYVNTIGMRDGYVEFCPGNNPPLFEEIISWIWVIRPDLSQEILKEKLSVDLQSLIEAYQKNEMSGWWSFIIHR
jgi:hypothetical protein